MRRTTLNVFFAIAAAALIINCSKKSDGGGTSTTGGGTNNTVCLDGNVPTVPQPQKSWRVNASAVHCDDATLNTELQSLKSGGDPVFEPNVIAGDANTSNPNFVFQVNPTSSGGNVIFTYGGLYSNSLASMTVTFEQATESSAGVVPTSGWSTVATQSPNHQLMVFEFLPQTGVWWRVTLNAPSGFSGELDMVDLGLYDVGGNSAKDYWIMTGASIEVQSFLNFTFKDAVKAAYPGYDPILANEAASGWLTSDLLTNLPTILALHPHAKYVGIHIGGNDVTNERPYPRGNDTLKGNLQLILQAITAAGKIPILARLTYRQYPAADPSGDSNVPVPPETNGSGPYVMNTFDPLIKQWSPRFYDCTSYPDEPNGRGLVDGYNFTLNNPNYLLPLCTGTDGNGNRTPTGCDPLGTHLSQTGATAWLNYWVDVAGAVVYGEQPTQ